MSKAGRRASRAKRGERGGCRRTGRAKRGDELRSSHSLFGVSTATVFHLHVQSRPPSEPSEARRARRLSTNRPSEARRRTPLMCCCSHALAAVGGSMPVCVFLLHERPSMEEKNATRPTPCLSYASPLQTGTNTSADLTNRRISMHSRWSGSQCHFLRKK